MNIRKNKFFVVLVAFNLILLNGCEGCGGKSTQDDKKTKLKTEAQQLVDKLSDKVKLKDEQKKKLESEMVEDLPSEVNIKTWVQDFELLQTKLKVAGPGNPLQDVNDTIKKVIPYFPEIKDLLEASEVVDIWIKLFKNAKERGKLDEKSKK